MGELRQILAEAGVQLLRPDLVIMDEFQRFAELLDPNSTSKSAKLLRTFISSEHERNTAPTKVLLLSATPTAGSTGRGRLAPRGLHLDAAVPLRQPAGSDR